MGDKRGEIPVLVPGIEFAEPGKAQPQVDDTARKLYTDSLPISVQIRTNTGVGSGVILDKDGSIGTAAHVVLDSREHFAIASDGTTYKVEITKLDDINDTAILKPVGYKSGSLPFAELGSSKNIADQDRVFSLGYPSGWRPAYLSPGNFSGALLNEDLLKNIHKLESGSFSDEELLNSVTDNELENMKAALKRDLLSADIHIRSGDSGGPVFDSNGKLIGLNDMDHFAQERLLHSG